MFQSDRIFVLAPHTDDGELGCGGTIAKYIASGKEVIYIAFSTCAQSLPTGLPADTLVKECRSATGNLGIKAEHLIILDFEVRQFYNQRQEILDQLLQLKKQYKPKTIFLPAKADVHQDHQVIYAEGMRAFKYEHVLGYELPWNNTQFQPTLFEKITDEQLLQKVSALQAYQSQSQRSYMQENFIRSLATVRGVQCNAELAEAFEVYRMSL